MKDRAFSPSLWAWFDLACSVSDFVGDQTLSSNTFGFQEVLAGNGDSQVDIMTAAVINLADYEPRTTGLCSRGLAGRASSADVRILKGSFEIVD
jgi:hypothetical protein